MSCVHTAADEHCAKLVGIAKLVARGQHPLNMQQGFDQQPESAAVHTAEARNAVVKSDIAPMVARACRAWQGPGKGLARTFVSACLNQMRMTETHFE